MPSNPRVSGWQPAGKWWPLPQPRRDGKISSFDNVVLRTGQIMDFDPDEWPAAIELICQVGLASGVHYGGALWELVYLAQGQLQPTKNAPGLVCGNFSVGELKTP
jgi:hypothetical protein